MRSVILICLALGACARGAAPPFIPPADDPLDTETHVDTDHPAQDMRRPLCLVEASPPPTPPEIVAWRDWLWGSDEALYGRRRADELEALGADVGVTPQEQTANLTERGWNRLRLGDVDGSLADLQLAESIAVASAPGARGRARVILAAAWMRKAEVDNCVSDGTGAACLVPFDPDGEHAMKEGMTQACGVLEDVLTEDDPDDIVRRWLLNIGHMALGDYPDGVPEVWRMPTEALAPEAELPPWTNVAAAVGIARSGNAGQANINDFDGDGLLDLLTSNTDPSKGLWLHLNQGNGRFCDASDAAGVSGSVNHLGFTVADYDNDGDLDILGTRGGWMDMGGHVRVSLMRNDGEGRFVDVAVEAGMADLVGPSQTSCWGDFDNDGWVDVFVGREKGADRQVVDSSLYMNDRDETFTDTADAAGVRTPGYAKGCAAGDVDNDGDTDLFVNVFNGPNRLYQNQGDGTFLPYPGAVAVRDPNWGFSTFFFDYDQDGWLDLLAAAYPNLSGANGPLDEEYGLSAQDYVRDLFGLRTDADTATLYRNTGGAFVDVTEAVGLDDVHNVMGSSFGDMDADGYPDLYFGTGGQAYDAIELNVAYHNRGGAAFDDVTTATHTGHIQKGHGVAFGDLDEDGDEDLYADIGGAYVGDAFPNALFVNPTAAPRGVHLRLEGVTSNRSAIGARVRVVTSERTGHYVVGTGSSFGGNSLQVEAALGPTATLQRVEIDWPGGETEVIDGVEPGTVTWIRQGDGVVDARAMRPFALAGSDEMEH